MSGATSARTSEPRTAVADPVPAVSVVEQVATTIRRMIMSGELRPGQSFSLRNMARELGVSFIPVREALRSLESQGLVVTTPGKSTTVAPISRSDLQAIYRLRLRIEPDIAHRSSQLLLPEDFEELDRLVSVLGDELNTLDDIFDSHHDFHAKLLEPAATGWDMRTLEGLWHAGERYVRLTFSGLDTEPGEHQRRELAHQRLVDAFRQGPAEAEAELRSHLRANEQIALTALEHLEQTVPSD